MSEVVVEQVESSDGPARVHFSLPLEPPTQRRWSVFFRIFQALPHFFVVGFVGYLAIGATIGGWFIALVKGRIPSGLQRFLTGYLRYLSDVAAYGSLLTNKWPTINFSPQPETPIRLEVDHVRLNRVAVFFRVILALPASIVASCVGWAVIFYIVAMWIVGVVRGRTPRPLHQAVATFLRFQIRTYAYLMLLTPTQPFKGWLGEMATASTPTEEPLDNAPTLSDTALSSPAVGWFITRSARRLVVIGLIVGAVAQIGYYVFAPQNIFDTNQYIYLNNDVAISYKNTIAETNQLVSAFTNSRCSTTNCVSALAYGPAFNDLHSSLTTLQTDGPFGANINGPMSAYVLYLSKLINDTRAIANGTSISQQKSLLLGQYRQDVSVLTSVGMTIFVALNS